MSNGTAVRRGFGIRAYIGPNGHGKSLAMVNDALASLSGGRPVLSNVRLLDYVNPRACDDQACTSTDHDRHQAAHPLFIPLVDFSQLLDATNCDVLLDEITGVASSRESSSLPVQVVNMLVQLRRRDVTLSWTAPAWSRADKVLREVSQVVVECRGYMPVKRLSEDGESMWRDRRLFRWSAYDATAFDEWSAGKRETAHKLVGQWHWRPKGLAHSAYDTFDQVSSLGWAMESGLCMSCGGRRAVPRCECGRGQGTQGGASRPSTSPRPTRTERRNVASQRVRAGLDANRGSL